LTSTRTTTLGLALALAAFSMAVRADGLNGTNAPDPQPATNSFWQPPGVGHDGADWVQLKSGEWLRGHLKYIQNKQVEFDSDELDELTLKLRNVRTVYTAHRVFTQFEGREPSYGHATISNNVVLVDGEAPISLPLDLLIGITPSGKKTGIRNWSGKASVGISMQSGNNTATSVTSSAELARRTPNTTLLLDYLGNYSQVNDVQSANNDRLNLTYDIRLNRDWFVRPVQFEWYHDPLANISYRLTAGIGAGYYIFDRTGLEWWLAAGPSYQYTRFLTVEPGQSDTATTPAGLLESKFKADITQRLTFIQTWQSIFTSSQAGQYTHHSVTSLEFEIKRHLDLDVSFVWDYLQNPRQQSDGIIPQKSDTYLTVGLGVRF
jgi:putative salt-induced outer membrane protein YdiY